MKQLPYWPSLVPQQFNSPQNFFYHWIFYTSLLPINEQQQVNQTQSLTALSSSEPLSLKNIKEPSKVEVEDCVELSVILQDFHCLQPLDQWYRIFHQRDVHHDCSRSPNCFLHLHHVWTGRYFPDYKAENGKQILYIGHPNIARHILSKPISLAYFGIWRVHSGVDDTRLQIK